ncbi:hypothetical protein D915_007194 [Fasciola hepatica]|uniref:Secreted protein n=1 Tax=Fasciola hepatica TaxID=6192 RepID=A0A4E0RV50_FASHE|nr:hypothetical protein D915_007194 [Fasciola hepatica]
MSLIIRLLLGYSLLFTVGKHIAEKKLGEATGRVAENSECNLPRCTVVHFFEELGLNESSIVNCHVSEFVI